MGLAFEMDLFFPGSRGFFLAWLLGFIKVVCMACQSCSCICLRLEIKQFIIHISLSRNKTTCLEMGRVKLIKVLFDTLYRYLYE